MIKRRPPARSKGDVVRKKRLKVAPANEADAHAFFLLQDIQPFESS
jgi:hypothetical protein